MKYRLNNLDRYLLRAAEYYDYTSHSQLRISIGRFMPIDCVVETVV